MTDQMLLAEPDDPQLLELFAELSDRLQLLTGDDGQSSFAIDELKDSGAMAVLCRNSEGRAIGCCVLRPFAAGVGEVKRMYVRAAGSGVATDLLRFVEDLGAARDYTQLVLSTRRVNKRAVAFYCKHGYCPIEPWGKYMNNPLSICLGKYVTMPASF